MTTSSNNDTDVLHTLEMLERFNKQRELLSQAEDKFLREARNKHGKTFEANGKFFQIRERVNKSTGRKVMYLCTLKSRPADWLAAGRARRKKEQAERLATAGVVRRRVVTPNTTDVVEPEQDRQKMEEMMQGFNELLKGMYGTNSEIVME
jgi:hypothetical protein